MPRYRLLLADDSITIQRVIELTFASENVEVVAVSDGEEAMARIVTDHPDIVLADIAMPKRSGYEVAAFVKADPALAHIPVVLLAGAFEPVDETRAREAGSDGVLVKPFEPQHVIARVRELLAGVKGDPAQAAAGDIPRPAARLAGPRPVELPKRERPNVLTVDNNDFEFGPQSTSAPQRHVTRPRAVAQPQAPIVEAPGDEDSLDDYFDRLDASFADLDDAGGTNIRRVGASTSAPRSEGPVMERDLDYLDPAALGPAGAADDELAGEADEEAPSVHVSEIPTLEELLGEVGGDAGEAETFSFDEAPPPAAAPAPVASISPVQPPPIEPPDMSATLSPAPQPVESVRPPAAAPSAPPPPASASPVAAPRTAIADVFSALLAVEQGEPGAHVPRAQPPAPAIDTDAIANDVTERVLARLQAQTGDVQDMVSRIVSEVAERLVREEIARIRNK